VTISASTDTELKDWLFWAQKRGSFLRTIAEAAFIADSKHYEVLRPVLLKLKELHPASRQLGDCVELTRQMAPKKRDWSN